MLGLLLLATTILETPQDPYTKDFVCGNILGADNRGSPWVADTVVITARSETTAIQMYKARVPRAFGVLCTRRGGSTRYECRDGRKVSVDVTARNAFEASQVAGTGHTCRSLQDEQDSVRVSDSLSVAHRSPQAICDTTLIPGGYGNRVSCREPGTVVTTRVLSPDRPVGAAATCDTSTLDGTISPCTTLPSETSSQTEVEERAVYPLQDTTTTDIGGPNQTPSSATPPVPPSTVAKTVTSTTGARTSDWTLVLGLLIVATTATAVLYVVRRRRRRRCPWCAEEIRVDARICRYCQREVSNDDVVSNVSHGESRRVFAWLHNVFSTSRQTTPAYGPIDNAPDIAPAVQPTRPHSEHEGPPDPTPITDHASGNTTSGTSTQRTQQGEGSISEEIGVGVVFGVKLAAGVGAVMVPLALLFALFEEVTSEGGSPNVEAVGPRSSGYSQPTTIDEANTQVVGTWSCKVEVPELGRAYWDKVVFEAGGTWKWYNAWVDEDGWPQDPSFAGTWTIGSSKYADTGRRYFYVELYGRSLVTGIESGFVPRRWPFRSGGIEQRASGRAECVLTRGDRAVFY